MVRDAWPIVRRIIDMVNVQVNPNSKNINTGPVSRRKFVMKYSGILKAIDERILLGRSQMIEDTASENGWYKA